MAQKHKHADVIIDWALGEQIEFFDEYSGEWHLIEQGETPDWHPDVQYRKYVPPAEITGIIELLPGKCLFRPVEHWESPNIKLVFNNNKLISATII